jgi:phage-related holin
MINQCFVTCYKLLTYLMVSIHKLLTSLVLQIGIFLDNLVFYHFYVNLENTVNYFRAWIDSL